MTAFALKREELLTADNMLLAILAVVALLFGYLSFAPSSLSARQGTGEKVALISDIDSTVKRKPAGAIAWDEADAPDELYTGDQIFTDKSSQAKIRFDDGSEISIAENSLVKIEKQGNKTTLDMSKGFVSGKFGGEGKGDFTIKMGTTQVKLDKGAELQLKVDPNDKNATRISLVSGDANVQSASGEKLALAKNQVLSVDTKTGVATVQDVSVSLVLPKAGEQLDAGDNPSVFFKWEAKAKNLTYTVVVARDSQFKNVIQRRETSNKALTVQAPPSGVYYWKVLSQDSQSGKKDESIESSFTVSRMDPPELLAPAFGKAFAMESAKKPVVVAFLWRDSGAAASFDVEVARDKAFQEKVISRRLSDTSFDTKELGQGVYYWRVRARGQDAAKSGPYSVTQEFRVDRLEAPKPPELLAPDSGRRFAPTEAITFRWSAQPGVDTYQFDISRTKAFAGGDGTVSKSVNGTAMTLVPETPGTHYWRVKSVDPFGRETAYSEVRMLGLDAVTPQLISPEDGAQITLAQKDLRVDFAWLKSQGAKGYQIEVARDAGFADKVVTQKVEGTQFAWAKLQPGQYHWRVRPEVPGVKDGPASPARRLELKSLDLLPPPNLKDRYYFRIPPPSGPGTAMLKTLFRFLMNTGTAKAQDASSEVDPNDSDKVIIQWKPIPKAESYYVEVAPDPDFAQTLINRKTKAPTFVWPDAKPGRYFLRAASVDALETTGSFSRHSELVVNYRAPKLYEPPDKSVLKLDSAKAPVEFTWQNVGTDPQLTLEVATAADFQKPVVTKAVKGGTVKLPGLGDGTYFWRVVAKYRSNLPVDSSRPFRFQILAAKLKAPEILAPQPNASLPTDLPVLPVAVQWSEVKDAESYELLIARDAGFTDLAAAKTGTGTEAAADLAPGAYYARVHAVGAGAKKGPYSEVRAFTVKGLLPAPEWVSPASDEEFLLTGKELPGIELVYKAVPNAAAYVLELATTSEFQKIVKKATLKDVKTTLKLPKGSYYARVHAVSQTAEAGKMSDVRAFSVIRQDLDAPDLIYPEDGDLLSRSQSVKLNWTKENAFTGYRVVMSRDPQFKKVVFDKTVAKDTQAVPVPNGGKYYWYVEGRDKQKKYAMRSDVQSFKVSDYAPSGGDKIRVMAAYAPSVISNTMTGDVINNSLSVAAFNSFVFSGQYWLTQPFGLEASYQRKSAELYSNENDLEGSTDQQPLEFIPQSFDLRTKFRLLLGKTSLSPELQLRGGYMYKTFYTYFAQSRTALDLQETKTHSLSLGIGAKFPLALDSYVEGSLDVAKPLAASPSEVTGGQFLQVDTGYYLLFPSRMTAGLGYRFANATYAFVDQSHELTGILQEKAYSVLGSLGYGF